MLPVRDSLAWQSRTARQAVIIGPFDVLRAFNILPIARADGTDQRRKGEREAKLNVRHSQNNVLTPVTFLFG